MYRVGVEVVDSMQAQAKALADPSRFQLFRFIADAERPVGVAELTDLLGFHHNAIRQHLAVLVGAQLVSESNEVRNVPGRPRKQYELRADALNAFANVSGSYQRLAELLLALAETGETPFDIGFHAGQNMAAPADEDRDDMQSLARQLAIEGFEPETTSSDTIRLGHCPFADLAVKNPGVVCELHRGLINGYLASLDGDITSDLHVRDPNAAGCLVTLGTR